MRTHRARLRACTLAAAAAAAILSPACSPSSSGAPPGPDASAVIPTADGASCDPSPPSCVPLGGSCPGGSGTCCQTGADMPVGAGCIGFTITCVPRCNSSADCAPGSCCIHNPSSVPADGGPPPEPGGWCLTNALVASYKEQCMPGYGNGYVCEGTYTCGYSCEPADGGAATDAGSLAVDGGGAPDAGSAPVDAAGTAGTCPAPVGGACTAIANVGATGAIACPAGTPPVMTGGAIADGTYVLAGVAYYGPLTADGGPCGGVAPAQTYLFGGGCAQKVSATGNPLTSSDTYAASGSQIVFTDVCPSPGSSTYQYTATATTISLLAESATGAAVVTTLQMQ